MNEKRLFGTDGIRGEAGSFPLDGETVERIGWALATVLAGSGGSSRVLIGRDPRESGPAIEEALTRGLVAASSQVSSGGVLTTPAVAYLTVSGGFDAGVVISASHNPHRDNGIKVFSRDGFKLPDEAELQVEALTLNRDQPIPPAGGSTPPRESDPLLRRSYVSSLRRALPDDFSFDGREVVLDCANGAATPVAVDAFALLGAKTHVIGGEPNGRNVNLGCGALHPEALRREVVRRGAFFGAAYDGDADRSILVDEAGTVRDGDDVLAIMATGMLRQGALGDPPVVVSTVMANLGLETYLTSLGIRLERAAVGDRNVLHRMRETGSGLGGEPSGHIIFLRHATTGDGILTSLRVAHAVAVSGRPMSELGSVWTRVPQLLRNVRVRERVDLGTVPELLAEMARVEEELGRRGRLLVRYSGTEPLLRIMLEGEDRAHIEALAARLEKTVAETLV